MSHPVNGIKERQSRQCIVSVTMYLHTVSPLENENVTIVISQYYA